VSAVRVGGARVSVARVRRRGAYPCAASSVHERIRWPCCRARTAVIIK